MSFYCPEKYKVDLPENINDKFLKELKGELSDKQARITLAQYLAANIGITSEILTGGEVKMAPFQEILAKGVMRRNFSMFVLGRGCGKSYIASQLAWLIPLFEPNTNIIIAGPTFRTARMIFSYLEKTVMQQKSGLLRQIFADPSKRNDLFEWKIVGNTCISTIRAIPLNGEKIRGFRANVLILDEFLLLSEDIVKNVLMPFLVAPPDIGDRMKTREAEDEMIASGDMLESEREEFKNKTRMIALTSASFTFENAYKVYCEWMDNILDDTKKVDKAKYFVARMGFEALPPYMIDKTVIEEAAAGGKENPSFLREYCARFIDGSDSYFSAKRMHDQTIKAGETPTLKIVGDKDKEYVLSIDPSWSSAKNSDYFAIELLEINDNGTISLVHNYAVAGGNLNDHIRYFLYLLLSFNIVIIIADNADGNFIQAANESAIFKERNINLGFIDYDGDLVGEDFDKMLKEVRKQYNLTSKRICFKHVFNQGSIRRINEQLQSFINTKKIWFGSKITPNDAEYERAIGTKIPYEFKDADGILELVADQDTLIDQTKKQCSLIEVKSSPTGGQVFDLPANLKRDKSDKRARKDNYTALMLGVEGYMAYCNILRQSAPEVKKMFSPVMYGNTTN